MSSKYTEAFDSLKSNEQTKRERVERVLSAKNVCSDEITVQSSASGAVKAHRRNPANKRAAASITIVIMTVIAVAVVLFLCLFLGNSKREPVNIHNILKNAQMVNDDFIGFSIGSKNAEISNDGYSVNRYNAAPDTETDENGATGLIAITENLEAEEVRFTLPSSFEEITNDDIAEYGAITKFFIMNNILYVEITAHEAIESDEVKESDYFLIGRTHAVFAIDLDSKKVYSLLDSFLNLGFRSGGEYPIVYDENWPYYGLCFALQHGLLITNRSVVNVKSETYFIDLHDNTLELKKVADTEAGAHFYVQDIHNNIYLIEDSEHHWDADMYDLNYINILTCDETNYDYFISTDKQIYRALKSSHTAIRTETAMNEYYGDVESLQKDKTWRAETSSSHKILTDRVGEDHYLDGGKWMLKNGKIVRIATDYCFNVDGKIISHVWIYNDDHRYEESVLYLCEESQITADFEYIDIYNSDNYVKYDKIAGYTHTEEDRYYPKYTITLTGHGCVLTEYFDGRAGHGKKYKMTVIDDDIELIEIKPIYNGFEVISKIVFLS